MQETYERGNSGCRLPYYLNLLKCREEGFRVSKVSDILSVLARLYFQYA